ncbi:molybdate ABC transporter substrate-binding protein [Hasllibacter sp. MH4015]|uniref:molybdate ABC transporter substrate-binding protein n=1 Tax=Hasllibacter sp. MH4015 TaxID=2854029 RepID=UPI001CD4912C|nr:molybdate ABC transporter substrate-binding protein [Hasllibacter sp. MH4015]
MFRALLTTFLFAHPALAGDVTLFAAASLGGPLDQIAEAWERETGHDVTLVYAGSSALARQVESGAPADIVLLANAAWMDHLEAVGAVQPGTRRDLLTNRLVLIGSWHRTDPVALADLGAALEGGRLAIALSDAVPAGIYARAALEELGLWGPLRPQIIETDNVRAAQLLVAIGAARMGIVYATDPVDERRVAVLAHVPEELHPPIRYPIALTVAARPEASAFLAYLDTPLARATLSGAGFGLVER